VSDVLRVAVVFLLCWSLLDAEISIVLGGRDQYI